MRRLSNAILLGTVAATTLTPAPASAAAVCTTFASAVQLDEGIYYTIFVVKTDVDASPFVTNVGPSCVVDLEFSVASCEQYAGRGVVHDGTREYAFGFAGGPAVAVVGQAQGSLTFAPNVLNGHACIAPGPGASELLVTGTIVAV